MPHTGAPMDQAALVNRQFDDVPRLIGGLERNNFDVKTALWLYSSEADQWYLYLASDIVDQKGAAQAYRELGRSMRRLTDLRIGQFDVKLIGPEHPLAKAVMEFQSISPDPRPTHVRGANLGKVYIEDAYIY